MSTHSFKVDVNEVLSEEMKIEIIRDEYRRAVSQVVTADKERILTNAAYGVVQKLVDDVFNEDLNTILTEKVTDIINNLSSYSVFKSKDAWGKDESKGWVYLQEALDDSRDRIHSRVRCIVEAYVSDIKQESRIQEMAQEAVYNVISDKLVGGGYE